MIGYFWGCIKKFKDPFDSRLRVGKRNVQFGEPVQGLIEHAQVGVERSQFTDCQPPLDDLRGPVPDNDDGSDIGQETDDCQSERIALDAGDTVLKVLLVFLEEVLFLRLFPGVGLDD